MFGRSNGFVQLSGLVDEHYRVGREIAGTFTAQAFEAKEVSTGSEVVVWITRGPIADAEIGRWKSRLEVLQKVPKVLSISLFGVDEDKVGFAVLAPFEGRRIDSPSDDRHELERRFGECIAVAEAVHAKAVSCGDLCLDSYVMNAKGSVSLFSILGDVKLDYEMNEFDRSRFLAFRPPEQRTGGANPASVDVYALSRLGEALFKRALSANGVGKETSAPSWLKNVVEAVASEEQRKETSSALALRMLVNDSKDREEASVEQDADNLSPRRVDPPEEGGASGGGVVEKLATFTKSRGGRTDESRGDEEIVALDAIEPEPESVGVKGGRKPKGVFRPNQSEKKGEEEVWVGPSELARAKAKSERKSRAEGVDSGSSGGSVDEALDKTRTALGRFFKRLFYRPRHPSSSPTDSKGAPSNRAMGLALIGVVLVVGLGIGLFMSKSPHEAIRVSPPEESFRVQFASVDELYRSNEPSVHKALVDSIVSSTSPTLRGYAFQKLAARSRRFGLSRTADIALGHYKHQKDKNEFGAESTTKRIMQLLDSEMSVNERQDILVKMYKLEPQLTPILTAAIALDTKDPEAFKSILAAAVSEQRGVSGSGERSVVALMLLLPDVHDLFSEDLIDMQAQLSSTDVAWLLQELGKRGQVEIMTVAQIAASRHIVEGAPLVFLRELQRSALFPTGLRAALAAGVRGELSDQDIKTLGQWYDPAAPEALEAAILSSDVVSVHRAAYESLTSKPIEDGYVARLLEFIRGAYGQEGVHYAKAIASIGLRDVIDPKRLEQELDIFRTAPRSGDAMKQLIKGAPDEVLQIVVGKYGDVLEPIDIIDLLAHPSPQIRLAAISNLTKVNDILLLKLITQSYDEERDQKVRAAYEANISVIRDKVRPAA